MELRSSKLHKTWKKNCFLCIKLKITPEEFFTIKKKTLKSLKSLFFLKSLSDFLIFLGNFLHCLIDKTLIFLRPKWNFVVTILSLWSRNKVLITYKNTQSRNESKAPIDSQLTEMIRKYIDPDKRMSRIIQFKQVVLRNFLKVQFLNSKINNTIRY